MLTALSQTLILYHDVNERLRVKGNHTCDLTRHHVKRWICYRVPVRPQNAVGLLTLMAPTVLVRKMLYRRSTLWSAV